MRTEFEDVGVIKEIKSRRLDEKYYFIRHKSGLGIYVYPKELTSAYAVLGTRYGSIDNGFKLSGEDEATNVPMGIAHFLEHKMFANEDGSDSFEKFSMFGADANAYTSYDKTVYLFSCTSHFSECLRELIAFVTTPYFSDEEVAKEQGIIAEEIGMYDDSPASRSYYAMLEGLYHKHDIKSNICGTVKSISEITPELLYRCHKVFYNPSNMVLAVCGNVDVEEILGICDELLPEGLQSDIIRSTVTEKIGAVREKSTLRMQLAKPLFDIGIKDTAVPSAPHERSERDVAMSIVCDLLFSQTGELYSTLYESGLISPSLSSAYTLSGTFGFCAVAGETDEPDKVYNIIKEHVLRKRDEGFSEEDFERCRKVFYASFVRELDSADDIANDLLAFAFDGYDFFGYAEQILSITLKRVMEIFRSSFDKDCFTLSVVYPFDSDENETEECSK